MAEGSTKKAILQIPANISGASYPEGGGTVATETRCTNMILVNTPNSAYSKISAARRPGVTEVATDAAFSKITNFYTWIGYADAGQLVYSGVGSSVDKLNVSGVTVYSHSDSTKIRYVTEMLNSSGTSCLVWTRASDAWIYPKGGAVAQLSSVPATMSGGLINIDGWTFVACNTTNGARIYNSSLNDPTAGYSDYVSVNIHPDTLVTVYKYKNFCLAFGTDSLEWFQVSDNEFGSPLKRVPQYFSKVGLIAPDTDGIPAICEGNDTIYWIAKGAHVGAPQIYTMSGTTPKRISTSVVEQELFYYNSVNQISIKYVTIYGSKLLLVCLGGGEGAYVYHIDFDCWSFWSGSQVTWGSISNVPSTGYLIYVAAYNSNTYGKIDQSGGVATLDFNQAISSKIVFPPANFGTFAKKTITKVRVLATSRGSGQLSGTLSWWKPMVTDDIPVSRSLSATTSDIMYTTNLGTYRDVVFRFEKSVGANFALVEGLEVEYEVLDD